MKEFKQFVNEMSIAAHGDWKGNKSFFSTIGIPVLKRWKLVGNLGNFEVRKQDGSKLSYVVGFKTTIEDTEKFKVITQIELTRDKETESMFTMYKNIYIVTGVITDLDYMGRGIGKALYKFLIENENITLMGDSTQYFGARKLWSSISKDSSIIVDIIDIANGDILEKGVKLKHGNEDSQFDPRVWSRDIDKVFIRPIMKKII